MNNDIFITSSEKSALFIIEYLLPFVQLSLVFESNNVSLFLFCFSYTP